MTTEDLLYEAVLILAGGVTLIGMVVNNDYSLATRDHLFFLLLYSVGGIVNILLFPLFLVINPAKGKYFSKIFTSLEIKVSSSVKAILIVFVMGVFLLGIISLWYIFTALP